MNSPNKAKLFTFFRGGGIAVALNCKGKVLWGMSERGLGRYRALSRRQKIDVRPALFPLLIGSNPHECFEVFFGLALLLHCLFFPRNFVVTSSVADLIGSGFYLNVVSKNFVKTLECIALPFGL